MEAINKAGYSKEIVIGMDVAASEFFREGKYDLDFKSPEDPERYITPDELADLYKSFVRDYPGILPTLSFYTSSYPMANSGTDKQCWSHARVNFSHTAMKRSTLPAKFNVLSSVSRRSELKEISKILAS